MTGQERRKIIIDAMEKSNEPLSGSDLGKFTNVSRQVVVQDIALLRAQGYTIVSTNRGYILTDVHRFTRLVKVHHSEEKTVDELQTIVDLGGTVVDVHVNHRVYGKVKAQLNIKNRRDIKLFLQDMQTGKSTPLMNITAGYHFHLISAESKEVLDDIEAALREKDYLAEVLPYEVED
ncbi:transcription repressor NadR [Pectinatus brassicae]|uniref:Transcription repressor NadR n=1 Tax=Pectinatus brassicae TaxID=862415 RepID=A0A840UBU3_9FIRM|nr:transcription repressor NadR [Pectinatus brassicae]MBB5335201.1 hypothetical protein [Pectinatus brassicae]